MERRRQRTAPKQNGLLRLMQQLLDNVVRFRFIIGLVVVIVAVALNLNGSSMQAWNGVLSERTNGKDTTDVIAGKIRLVRSDEWLVQTPFYLSQAEKDYPVVNKSFSNDGQNMIIAYNAPVKDITAIGKPFNWGFFFLGRDRGLSFYWAFKIVGMVLLAFEVSMILTKRNKYFSLLGAFWITFAPGVQWWFMQHFGDLVFDTLGLMIAFYYYFSEHDNKPKRFFMVLLAIICTIGFVLVIYPAHQVMLAYLVLFWLVGLLLIYWKDIRWDVSDAVMIIPALLFVGAVLFHFYHISADAIKASMDTIYPGKRVDTGGNFAKGTFSYAFTNWLISKRDINFLNNCEVASFYHFFPVIALALPFTRKFDWKNRQFQLGMILFAFCVASLLWMFVGLPTSLAKLTLLSYTVSKRAAVDFGFGAALLSIWFLGYLAQREKLNLKVRLAIIFIFVSFSAYDMLNSPIKTYFSQLEFVVVVGMIILLTYLLLSKHFKLFALFFAIVIGLSGFFVNPIVHGTGAITEKKLGREIQKVAKTDPNGTWLAEEFLYNYVPALGVKTFNTVMFYPDSKTMKSIDDSKAAEKIWNRYAHIHAAVVPDAKSSFSYTQFDVYTINLSAAELKKQKIKFVATKKDLNTLMANQSIAHFVKLYGPDKNGYQIYRVDY